MGRKGGVGFENQKRKKWDFQDFTKKTTIPEKARGGQKDLKGSPAAE